MIVNAQGHEINGNGADLTERQKAKLGAMNATINDVNEIAHAHAVQAMNHLGNQIPALVHSIITAAIQGYHQSLIEMGVIPAPPVVSDSAPAPADFCDCEAETEELTATSCHEFTTSTPPTVPAGDYGDTEAPA